MKIYIWEIRGSQKLKNPATRKKWPRHRIPEWWSSKWATAPALYHIVPSLRIVPHECQHARDPTDGGIATLNTPGPVSFSVKPISDACAPPADSDCARLSRGYVKFGVVAVFFLDQAGGQG